MSYISPEIIEKVKQIDLKSYLETFEPQELVRVSPGEYSTRTHDSLKISHGKWMWWSRGIGGRNAVDYLMKVKEMTFYEAVKYICELTHTLPTRKAAPIPPQNKAPPEKYLQIPEKASNNDKLIEYLQSRGISKTVTDDLSLDTIGEKKTAVFGVIPDNDSSFNFIIGMLYTQLFQQLYYSADFKHGGCLPVHVHFVMDEFANVALPDEFDKLLATMRSRGISVSIIIQNMAQLKALFEKQWESIVGNCDEFLYLGGNEQSTHKYVSELLGKETIDTNTYGQSKGRNGSYSTNYQISGRELLTPDEVRLLDNQFALLFIRGERPIKDLKYDILKHPNVKLSIDGGNKPYLHGFEDHSVGNMLFFEDDEETPDTEFDESVFGDYEIYSSDEINELLELLSKEENLNEEE